MRSIVYCGERGSLVQGKVSYQWEQAGIDGRIRMDRYWDFEYRIMGDTLYGELGFVGEVDRVIGNGVLRVGMYRDVWYDKGQRIMERLGGYDYSDGQAEEVVREIEVVGDGQRVYLLGYRGEKAVWRVVDWRLNQGLRGDGWCNDWEALGVTWPIAGMVEEPVEIEPAMPREVSLQLQVPGVLSPWLECDGILP